MALDAAEMVGFVAGGLSSMASVPQAIKIVRERSAHEVSTRTYLLMVGGAILWISYGVLRGSPAIMLWNSVWLLMSLTVLALKYLWAPKAG